MSTADRLDQTLPTWCQGHAAPEDRAVGLELELIELVRRRNDGWADGPALDRDIASVLEELSGL